MELDHTGGTERRKFLRLSKKFSLRHSRYVPLNFDDKVLDGTTLNISGGGLLFLSTEKYNKSELLRLEMDIPDWQKFIPPAASEIEKHPPGPFVAKAIVTRVDYIGESNYHIAASFVGLNRQEIWALMFAINKK